MQLFTVTEANALLPRVRPLLDKLKSAHSGLMKARPDARAAANQAEKGGGGFAGGSHYLTQLFGFSQLTSEIENLGIQIKDYSRGLIDFPSMREGKIVLLCWQLGEEERIEWWHETEAGFAGRQRL